MSRKNKDGNWGKPVNLGYPINTSKNENSLLVDAEGRLAYFGSDRAGGFGGLDIYSFQLSKEVRPNLVTFMKGVVFDKESKVRLGVKFELVDLQTDSMIVESRSDKSNGEFLVPLPSNGNYALNVSAPNYLFYSENFSLKEKQYSEPFLMDVPLQPIKKGGNVVLKNVFFETDAFNLKAESKIELGKLVEFLEINKNVIIEIRGHTDNVGSASHNKELSTNRAKTVWDYLVTHEIFEDRISYKGYGDEKPIASNDTEEGKAKNRRTEFTIVSN
ncbi:MAG: OmpA family protein [Flavobacteriales bacterium]|nr:OmpA family protein [Flavobacteriales bacterium]